MYTITLSPAGDRVPGGPDETVLAAILRSGASVVFSCRGGSCGTCKMRVISGRIEHGRYSAAALQEEERDSGWFLSCQARALGDVTIADCRQQVSHVDLAAAFLGVYHRVVLTRFRAMW